MNRRKFLLGSALVLPSLQLMPVTRLLAEETTDANTLFVMDVDFLHKVGHSIDAKRRGVMALDVPIDLLWREHIVPLLVQRQPTIVGITDEMSAFQLQMFGTEQFYRRDSVDLLEFGIDCDPSDLMSWALKPIVSPVSRT